MMIAVWSAKEGTGVSALTLGIAKVIQEENPVLMDFNLSSPTLAALIGLENTQYGLDRVLLHSNAETIEKALQDNLINHEGFTILPGVQYPPKRVEQHDLIMRTIQEATKDKTVIVDAGSGVIHPLQKELLMRADIILVVVTPYLMTYHHLWRMWQNDFFIPYEQTNKIGLIVNQFYGSVTPQDIATLMDLWLAGDLPIIKKMTESLNHSNLDDAFTKTFSKRLKDIINRSVDRMEQTNTMVKQTSSNITDKTNEFSYKDMEKQPEWNIPETWETEENNQKDTKDMYQIPKGKEEWHFES